MAIFIAVILAFVLQLAIWEGVALGIVWLINALTVLSISYTIVGVIVFAIWFIILLIKGLFIYGASKF